MTANKQIVTSGIPDFDQLLGGGIFIGDNVIWYDDSGLLATVFSHNLVKASRAAKKALIYISFDHSPKSLLEKLGPLAASRHLTILDCFTHGKGESSELFLDFYNRPETDRPCRIVCLDAPQDAEQVARAFYSLHADLPEDVRFIFESLTGMQELWGSEEDILKFYARACPRLYELNTIAYWIVEKGAHSEQLKAHFNKITQVAIDLSLKRGKTYLSVLKAEKRDLTTLNRPAVYWGRDLRVALDPDDIRTGRMDLGRQLKMLRTQQGMSQKDLARQVGVTPSNISQVENNQIYPSLPALIKMSEIFSVDISRFFQDDARVRPSVVFHESEAVPESLTGRPKSAVSARRLIPNKPDARFLPYLVDFPPETELNGHFFACKGDEMGYLLAGELHLVIEEKERRLQPGDTVYLTSAVPSLWKNSGRQPARLLWIKERQRGYFTSQV